MTTQQCVAPKVIRIFNCYCRFIFSNPQKGHAYTKNISLSILYRSYYLWESIRRVQGCKELGSIWRGTSRAKKTQAGLPKN